MRTDNPVLSTEAVDLARKCVTSNYGANMLQPVGREREAKKPKGSQVRDASISCVLHNMRTCAAHASDRNDKDARACMARLWAQRP
jgi:hypothetical protein